MRIVLARNGRLWLEGDSTLHRYRAAATQFTVSVDVAPGAPPDLEACLRGGFVTGALVSVPVDRLESGDNRLDGNLRKALRGEKHPAISFRADSIRPIPPPTPGCDFGVEARGVLSAAGVERPLAIQASALREAAGLRVTGGVDVLMSDHGIKPPALLLGMLRADNRVDLRFDLVLAASIDEGRPGNR